MNTLGVIAVGMALATMIVLRPRALLPTTPLARYLYLGVGALIVTGLIWWFFPWASVPYPQQIPWWFGPLLGILVLGAAVVLVAYFIRSRRAVQAAVAPAPPPAQPPAPAQVVATTDRTRTVVGLVTFTVVGCGLGWAVWHMSGMGGVDAARFLPLQIAGCVLLAGVAVAIVLEYGRIIVTKKLVISLVALVGTLLVFSPHLAGIDMPAVPSTVPQVPADADRVWFIPVGAGLLAMVFAKYLSNRSVSWGQALVTGVLVAIASSMLLGSWVYEGGFGELTADRTERLVLFAVIGVMAWLLFTGAIIELAIIGTVLVVAASFLGFI